MIRALTSIAAQPAPVKADPVFAPVDPLVEATEQSAARIEAGSAVVQGFFNTLTNNGDHGPILNYTNASINFWQNMQLADPGNGDTPGTLGYFAVSARDFWSEIGDAYDNGAHPNAIIEQLNIWRDYTTYIRSEPIPAQPIDLWFEAPKPTVLVPTSSTDQRPEVPTLNHMAAFTDNNTPTDNWEASWGGVVWSFPSNFQIVKVKHKSQGGYRLSTASGEVVMANNNRQLTSHDVNLAGSTLHFNSWSGNRVRLYYLELWGFYV